MFAGLERPSCWGYKGSSFSLFPLHFPPSASHSPSLSNNTILFRSRYFSFPPMGPRRKLDAFLDQGEQRGGQDERGIINDDELRKALQPGTERDYDRSVALWDGKVDPSSLVDLTTFMLTMTIAMRGACLAPT